MHLELNIVIKSIMSEKNVQNFTKNCINFLLLWLINVNNLFVQFISVSQQFFYRSMFLHMHLWQNHFRESPSVNRDPGISRGLAPSVVLHLTDETDICDGTRGFFACSFEIWVRLRNACVHMYDCALSIAMFQSEMSSLFNFHENEARFSARLFNRRACSRAK